MNIRVGLFIVSMDHVLLVYLSGLLVVLTSGCYNSKI